MGGLLELSRLPGRERLKPPLAVGEVDRQILPGTIFSGGIEQDGSEKLVAGRNVGNHIRGGPSIAEGAPRPALGWERIHHLQIPAPRLSEPAGLRLHSVYLNSLPL